MGFCCSCESLWLAPGWRGQTSHWRVSDARFFLSDSFATLTVSRKTFYSLLFHCKPLFVLLLGKFNFRVPQGVRGPQTVKRHFWTFDGTGLWARNQNWCSLKFWTNSVSCRKKDLILFTSSAWWEFMSTEEKTFHVFRFWLRQCRYNEPFLFQLWPAKPEASTLQIAMELAGTCRTSYCRQLLTTG